MPKGTVGTTPRSNRSAATTVAALPDNAISPIYVFLVGVGLILLAVLLDFLVRDPSEPQERATCILLSLGGAGFALGLTGSFQFKTKYLQGGGAIAVFAFLLWMTYPHPRSDGINSAATSVLPQPPIISSREPLR
jgi:uncharacterized protein YjeT (DUF2065 family)